MPDILWFYIKFKEFHTFFDKIKLFESIRIIYIPADDVFKREIRPSDERILPDTVCALYVFNSSTDWRFDEIEFKKLHINSTVSTR